MNINQKLKLKKPLFLFAGLSLFFFTPTAGLAQELSVPGALNGVGNHFELTDSKYLNITLDSSQSIKLNLQSIPEMITTQIEVDSSVFPSPVSTQISLSGFPSNTTYYLYQDNYHNEIKFVTDSNGTFSYIQDLTNPHFVFIQPKKSTKFIKDDLTGGDCYLIGLWNASTKTCTLTTDLTETIQVDSDNLILDGNSHSLTGNNTGYGIYLPVRNSITIKNFNISGFYVGIYLDGADDNNVINNITNFNVTGIAANLGADRNNIINNTANYNLQYGGGITIYNHSRNNIVEGNTTNFNNNHGIVLNSNFPLDNADYNIVRNNVSNSNMDFGIYIGTDNNTIVSNTTNFNSAGIGINGDYNYLSDIITQENSHFDLNIFYSPCNNVI